MEVVGSGSGSAVHAARMHRRGIRRRRIFDTLGICSANRGLRAPERSGQHRAWITYDWANSAYATTILAAVLPAYFAAES